MALNLSAFCRDERGAVIAAEMVLVGTVAVLGVITGLTCLQTAVVEELTEFSGALRSLNQSYAFTGFKGTCKAWGRASWTAGSFYQDLGHVQVGYVGGEMIDVVGPCNTGIAPVVAPTVAPAAPCQTGPCQTNGGVSAPCPITTPGCVTGPTGGLVPSPSPIPNPLPPAAIPAPAEEKGTPQPLPEPEPKKPPAAPQASAVKNPRLGQAAPLMGRAGRANTAG